MYHAFAIACLSSIWPWSVQWWLFWQFFNSNSSFISMISFIDLLVIVPIRLLKANLYSNTTSTCTNLHKRVRNWSSGCLNYRRPAAGQLARRQSNYLNIFDYIWMNKGNFRLQEFGAIAHGQGRAEEPTLPLLFDSAWNCFRLVPPLLDDGFAMSDLCRSWHVTLWPTGLLGPGRREPAAARTDCWAGEAAVAKGHCEGPESPMWKNRHAGIQNKEFHKVEDGRHFIESDGNC